MKNPQSLDDLRDFHRSLTEKVSSGGVCLSPEEALDEWRTRHPLPEAKNQELAAIQEAIDDITKGDRGIPFAKFDQEFRARHGLPPAQS